jgi:hypothetical protein
LLLLKRSLNLTLASFYHSLSSLQLVFRLGERVIARCISSLAVTIYLFASLFATSQRISVNNSCHNVVVSGQVATNHLSVVFHTMDHKMILTALINNVFL